MSTTKNTLIFLITLIIISMFPQTPLGDTPYVCPYPCLPPPIPGSVINPPQLPPPSTTAANCPPPPSGPTYYESPPPPAPKQYYYYSPPPPFSSGYVPSYDYNPPSGGSGLFPYGNAPPPPDPILPYFPFYFKHPPLPPSESSSSSLTMVNQPWLVGLVLSLLFLL